MNTFDPHFQHLKTIFRHHFHPHFQHLKTIYSYQLFTVFNPRSRKQQDDCDSDHSTQDDFGTKLVAQECGSPRNSNSVTTPWKKPSQQDSTPALKDEFVGLTNTGLNCSVNVLLQTLYMIPEYKDIIMRYGRKSNLKEMDNSVLYKLYQVFQNLNSKKEVVRVEEFVQCLKLHHINVEFQMDVEELFRSLMHMIQEEQKCINRSVSPAETEVEETNIFSFTTEEHTVCSECESEFTQKEEMLNIPLSLHNPACDTPYESIEKSFEAFFSYHQLDQENAFYCDKCEWKTKTKQQCRMAYFPKVLCFQLKRFGYSTNLRKSVKISDSMTFPERCKISNKHRGQEDESIYDLFSVIVHRGTAYFGHYYAYIRHLPEREWYYFNDEIVTKASWKDIEISFGSSKHSYLGDDCVGTAYLLFYKKAKEITSPRCDA